MTQPPGWVPDPREAGIQTGSPALTGARVEPSWDPGLGATMRLQGMAVPEEVVLDGLIEGVSEWSSS